MHTSEQLKSQAKRLRAHLSSKGVAFSHSECLEAIASTHGFKDWNTACAADCTTFDADVATIYDPASGQLKPVSAAAQRLGPEGRKKLLLKLKDLTVNHMGKLNFLDALRESTLQGMISAWQDGAPNITLAQMLDIGSYLSALPGIKEGNLERAVQIHDDLLRELIYGDLSPSTMRNLMQQMS